MGPVAKQGESGSPIGAVAAAAVVVVSNQRRRRKRSRPSQHCGGTGRRDGSSALYAKAFVPGGPDSYRDDDTRFAFLDKDGDDLADGRPRYRSLPLLLEERRGGGWRSEKKRWQSEMLFRFTKKPAESYVARRQWRSFSHRRIPFTQLGSPASDAVLAMERSGDYLLSLGSMDGAAHTGLALRFYGIHGSAGRNRGIGSGSTRRAPLFQTTPLHSGESFAGGSIPNLGGEISPSTTPVELLISSDWKVGVAFLYPPRSNGTLQVGAQENEYNPGADQTASAVLFTLPRRQSPSGTAGRDGNEAPALSRVFEYKNAPVFRSDSRRKLLWCVESIPNTARKSPGTNGSLCETCFRAPGYLLLTDEGDGFRLTWATEPSFLVPSCLEDVAADARFAGGRRASGGAGMLSHEPFCWEETRCRVRTGEAVTSLPGERGATATPAQVGIAGEGFLHLGVLLAEILSRRRGISEAGPEFCYSLVALNRAGRIADVVLGFARKRKACSIGVFVSIDLFAGLFVELDWVQSKGKKDAAQVQKWCNTLAVNRRMRETRAGPFSVPGRTAVDCSRLCRETFAFDNDEEDDYDESYWREFVLGKASGETKRRQAPKLVTLSSLYPCCDVITNNAITSFEPVMSIRAKCSPIQLVYN